MPNLTALLLGSTGETGKELLKHLCDCSQFTKVILVGRRRVEDGPSTVDKVEQRVVDFDKLVCICNGVIINQDYENTVYRDYYVLKSLADKV